MTKYPLLLHILNESKSISTFNLTKRNHTQNTNDTNNSNSNSYSNGGGANYEMEHEQLCDILVKCFENYSSALPSIDEVCRCVDV